MPFRILFTGSFGTGKTTLLNCFSQYPFVACISEVERDLLKENPLLERDPDFQKMVFVEHIYRETQAQLSGKSIVICDRGVIDVIAYSEFFGYPIKSEWRDALNNRYDLVAIFNMDDIPAAMPSIKEFRNKIDANIREVVDHFGFPKIELSGNVQTRETILLSHLKQLKIWPLSKL
jgi:predicted ATPase